MATNMGIPVGYLNLVAAAPGDGKTNWKNRDADWKSLNREIAHYRLLCDADNEGYNQKQIDTVAQTFAEKRQKLLSAHGYKSSDSHDDEDTWRYPNVGHSYANDYGEVFLRNMKVNRSASGPRHWFTDYYEEQP